MRNKQRGESLIGIVFLIAGICVILFGLVAWIDSASCSSKWEGSGLESKWGPLSGCLVKWPDGRWLPSDVIRDISLITEPKGK